MTAKSSFANPRNATLAAATILALLALLAVAFLVLPPPGDASELGAGNAVIGDLDPR